MKSIIFGVTGQDGSHLADLLLDKGYEVVGVCRRASTDNTGRIKRILDNQNFKIAQADIKAKLAENKENIEKVQTDLKTILESLKELSTLQSNK